MPQTSYSIYQPKGFEGSLAHAANGTSIQGTYGEFVNGESVYLPFGRVVVRDATNDFHLKLPSATGQDPVGISYAANAYEKDTDGTAGIPPQRPVSFVARGTVYCVAEVAIAIGDTVFFRHTVSGSPGAYDGIGRVRTDADTATADAWIGAKFVSAAAAGGLVAVEIL